MSEKAKLYTTVKIPKELIAEVDSMMNKHGFRSRSEFVKEAVRTLLREYATYETTE